MEVERQAAEAAEEIETEETEEAEEIEDAHENSSNDNNAQSTVEKHTHAGSSQEGIFSCYNNIL